MNAAAADATFGLYVHWPFCLSKCPYCDFNSHVAGEIEHKRWREAYLREMETLAPRLAGRRLASIFFGGGTPSLMDSDTVSQIIARAAKLWPGADDVEITLEANPTSVETGRFAAFRAAGVNRVSVGVQALDQAALDFLGRTHGPGDALAALAIARKYFSRINADLIYARPGQTLDAWRTEMARLLDEGLGHVSLYQLTIERGTPFYGLHRKGAFTLPDEDDAARLYDATGEVMAAAGLAAYEISNHARPGEECRHNLIYWRYFDYAGIGPGAHGRLSGPEDRAFATVNERRPEDWLAAVEEKGLGLAGETELSPRARLEEMTMMGLRLAQGIGDDDLARIGAGDIDTAFAPLRLARLIDGGFLIRDADRLRASDEGRARLNAVLAELLI